MVPNTLTNFIDCIFGRSFNIGKPHCAYIAEPPANMTTYSTRQTQAGASGCILLLGSERLSPLDPSSATPCERPENRVAVLSGHP